SRITPRLHQIISSSFISSTQNSDFSSEVGNQTQDLREEELRNCLSWKIETLARRQPVLSAFQSWIGDGFPVHRGDIFHAVNRLRKLNMNKRTLEVMEWVIRERPYKLKELDYSYLLEFKIKLHGISQGERLFSRVPPEFQNELLYNNLVMACLEKVAIRLSLAYMKKMRELGHPISPYVFNRLIILHSSPSRRKAIPRILTQMKADGVVPHVSTYNILLKIEANQHNIQGLTKVFDDMKQAQVEPNEITYCILATAHAVARLYAVSEVYVEAVEKVKTGDNWSTLDVLLMLYGYLGKEKELECTWGVVQQLPHVRNKSFVLSIEAFGRIGQLNRSEELWLEMKSSKQLRYTKQYNSIISVYCKHGHIDQASELFKEMEISVCKANAMMRNFQDPMGLCQSQVDSSNLNRCWTSLSGNRSGKPFIQNSGKSMDSPSGVESQATKRLKLEEDHLRKHVSKNKKPLLHLIFEYLDTNLEKLIDFHYMGPSPRPLPPSVIQGASGMMNQGRNTDIVAEDPNMLEFKEVPIVKRCKLVALSWACLHHVF
ncbi:pentatricopeptide repeat-containing protein At1g07590, mitochondrial-like, partial [Telopea speciosissima]|uniref:pentatricopeptide repeat-containing protein At1g07590, mitochondrial-like n=1 Tax=Telopea speciosissima TaxID=54955 RepID=UPI001CC4AB31